MSRTNRWMISGAVVLAAGLSALTAHAFHAHAAGTTSGSSASQPAGASQPSRDDGSSSPLQSPSQTPSAAPAPQAPVVSGGS